MSRLSALFRLANYALFEAGPRWTFYRIRHAIATRSGWERRKYPTDPAAQTYLSLADWKKLPVKFFFDDRESITLAQQPNERLRERGEAILAGSIPFFNARLCALGHDYDWLTNPESNHRYDAETHWIDVPDFSPDAGDIKYVWEKSRFSWLPILIRYDFHFEKDCAEFVFSQIESWIAANSINRGPNWKCSQEISLRMLNWLFALYYYKNSPALTEERFQAILHVCYWQLHHVRQNIDFSRIAVRNNHAITETMMLYLGGLFFPFFPEAARWSREGKDWLEKEIAYQIYKDGTYLQFSHNYHRVVVQLLTWTLYLSELNGREMSMVFRERALRSLQFLYDCQDELTGRLPNYGNNDGALFFPLNDRPYRDYRPQLNALYYWFYRKDLYGGKYTEDRRWYSSNLPERPITTEAAPPVRNTARYYSDGGFFVHRMDQTLTFLRCGDHRDRPAQADNLHLDLWHDGINFLRDAGSYKYNTDAETLSYFMGSRGHNTLALGPHDQMKKGGRFLWYGWTQSEKFSFTEDEDRILVQGSIRAFRHLGKNIEHRRQIAIHTKLRRWVVTDTVDHSTGLPLRQYWHPHPDHTDRLRITATLTDGTPLPVLTESHWYSSEYGERTPAPAWVFETGQHCIITTIQIL